MNIKTDAFFLKGVDQLRSQTGKVNPEPLDPIVKIRIHRFHNCVTATVVNINGSYTACRDVIQESAITHPGNSCVARSNSGAAAGGSTTTTEVIECSASYQLPNQEQRDADWENPKGYLTPALIHGFIVSNKTVRVSLPKPLFQGKVI
jgi:hypothetical protein